MAASSSPASPVDCGRSGYNVVRGGGGGGGGGNDGGDGEDKR